MAQLENNYTSIIEKLKQTSSKVKKDAKGHQTKNVARVSERTDLENLFVTCVDEVRKIVIKRRLQAEIHMRQGPSVGRDSQLNGHESLDGSLAKLADVAQERIKFEDFTPGDRNHLLDLFVNNEQTLIKFYELLFPGPPNHRNLQQLKN